MPDRRAFGPAGRPAAVQMAVATSPAERPRPHSHVALAPEDAQIEDASLDDLFLGYYGADAGA